MTVVRSPGPGQGPGQGPGPGPGAIPGSVPGPTPGQLLRAAQIVLSRPAMARAAAAYTAQAYADRHADALRRLWASSPTLRGLVPAEEAVPGPQLAEEKLLRRQRRRITELQERERLSRGRADQALQEAADLREQLRTMQSRLAEAEEQAASALLERGALSRRARDPLNALRTLHRALRPVPAPASNDPREAEHGAEHGAERGHGHEVAAAGPGPVAAFADALSEAEADSLRSVLDRILVPALPAPGSGRPVSAAVTTRTRSRGLTVRPLGGGTEIGGSCVLVEAGETRILVDAGIRQSDRLDAMAPGGLAEALAEGPPVRALVITHAHHDHCGYAPALVRDRPDLRILCTPPTGELLPLVWRDAQQLHARRTADRQNWGDTSADGLYGQPEVAEACARLDDLPYGTRTRIGDLTLELFPAGHVLGSAGVVVTAGDRKAVISGDVCTERQLGAEPLAMPDTARDADVLLLESTCCDTDHRPRPDVVADLLRSVRETCVDGGRVLIPAMALGRAQEIALLLRTSLPEVPVLIDGLARQIGEVYGGFPAAADAAAGPQSLSPSPPGFFRDNVRKVVDRRAERLAFRRGVVIATSGTLRGGPAVHWARDILADPAGALFFSGYQDEESPGRRLLELAEGGRKFELPDGQVDVRAAVKSFPLGAHADRAGLLAVVDRLRPSAVMLVHGRPGAQVAFRRALRARGETVVRTGEWHSPSLD